MIDFQAEQKEISAIRAQVRLLRDAHDRELKGIEEVCKEIEQSHKAQEVLQHCAQTVQQLAHQRISRIVTNALQTVFPDGYGFRIDFERKRGRTEARLKFTRSGEDFNPLLSSGGGPIDVAAFALRLACLVLHRPRLSQILILDEPFKMVSADYRENVRKMLETISREMGVQIVFVTHSEELATGKVIEICQSQSRE